MNNVLMQVFLLSPAHKSHVNGDSDISSSRLATRLPAGYKFHVGLRRATGPTALQVPQRQQNSKLTETHRDS